MRFLMFVSLVVLVVVREMSSASVIDSKTTTKPGVDKTKNKFEAFQYCMDKFLANTVEEIEVEQIRPVVSVIGDSLFRVNSAVEILTGQKSTPKPRIVVNDDDEDF